MKLFLAFTLLVVAGGVTAAPTAEAPENELFSKLREVVRQTLDDITKAAIADNPEIGHKILNTIQAETQKLKEKVQQAKLDGVPMTKERREQIFSTILQEFDQVKAALNEDLQKLKPETQESIKGIYAGGITKAKGIVEEIKAQSPQTSI